MDKLREEINKETEPVAKAVGKFILSLNLTEIPDGKTLKGCMEEIEKKILQRVKQKNGRAKVHVEDHIVYGWAAEYFGLVPDAPKAQAPVIHTPTTKPKHTDDLDYNLEDLIY